MIEKGDPEEGSPSFYTVGKKGDFFIFVADKISVIASAEVSKKWSRGRVARQSSAKACTAVRIRSRPQETSDTICIRGFFILQGNNQGNKIYFFYSKKTELRHKNRSNLPL